MSDKLKNILEWIECIVIAIVLALLIRYYVGTPTVVQMDSMYPTLKQGERLVLNRIPRTRKQLPKRGDIITFEQPSVTYIGEDKVDLSNPVAIYSNKSKGIFEQLKNSINIFSETSFIKRVIGLPGDHIEIKNERVYVNGDPIKENYLDAGTVTDSASGLFTDIVVPDGYVYVLGDNREVSCDSRLFGCIPVEKIEGKAVFRFWPLKKIGTLK